MQALVLRRGRYLLKYSGGNRTRLPHVLVNRRKAGVGQNFQTSVILKYGQLETLLILLILTTPLCIEQIELLLITKQPSSPPGKGY